MSALALSAPQSVHVAMAQTIIYVRRSYKEATAADVSDEAAVTTAVARTASESATSRKAV